MCQCKACASAARRTFDATSRNACNSENPRRNFARRNDGARDDASSANGLYLAPLRAPVRIQNALGRGRHQCSRVSTILMRRSISRSRGPSDVLLRLARARIVDGLRVRHAVGSPRVIGSTGSRGGPSGGVVSGFLRRWPRPSRSPGSDRLFSQRSLQGMCHERDGRRVHRLVPIPGKRAAPDLRIWCTAGRGLSAGAAAQRARAMRARCEAATVRGRTASLEAARSARAQRTRCRYAAAASASGLARVLLIFLRRPARRTTRRTAEEPNHECCI